ncbi:MAG: hypothetical protein HY955_07810 [Deltaproteobacteria bacterium]|nr:hypothetical protein [Deltaproteobacteria bacterium]
MRERRAVERLIERIYKERLKKTGKLPSGRETREIEVKAKKTAMDTENRKSRK